VYANTAADMSRGAAMQLLIAALVHCCCPDAAMGQCRACARTLRPLGLLRQDEDTATLIACVAQVFKLVNGCLKACILSMRHLVQ
jgi:hypothetical protein